MSRRKMDGTEVAIITTMVIAAAGLALALVAGIVSLYDSAWCDGKGGTFIDGKCYAHVEVMH